MFYRTTTHYVTCSVFALALSEYSYSNDKEEIDFTKTEAKQILDDHLFFNGIGSSWKGLDNMGDDQEKLNELFAKATIWVETNYPYLKIDEK